MSRPSKSALKAAPIALFDSGSGGLAVLRHLQKRLPQESILYLGDLAHFPIGEKSAEAIEKYSLMNGQFLEKLGAKMVVIACNTFSALGLEPLKRALSIPVMGLIEPCAGKVASVSKGRVGILATQATIRFKGYERAILERLPGALLFPKACPTLAYLIEQGLGEHPATYFVVEEALKKFRLEKIDTLVLGCSHYPLILPSLRRALKEEVIIVDSSESCIDEIVRLLRQEDLLSERQERGSERFFTTAGRELFQRVAPLFLGRAIPLPEEC